MLNYIKADLYRITKKKSLYILMALFTLVYTYFTFNLRGESDSFIEFNGIIIAMSPLLIGIFVFTAIYTDDLKSHAVQSAIGFGIKRTTVILTKFFEAAILLALFYVYALSHMLIINTIFDMNLNALILKMIFFNAISYYLLTLVYFAISGILIFSFQKATLSTVMYVLLSAGVIQQLFDIVLRLNFIQKTIGDLTPYLIENVINRFSNALVLGTNILSPALTIIAITALTITLSSFLFNKVELDF